MGFKQKPTTDYNPQGNVIIERIHQALGNQLRSFELEERDLNKEEKTFEPSSQLVLMQLGVRIIRHLRLRLASWSLDVT